MCMEEEEEDDDGHILFGCEVSKNVWAEADLWIIIESRVQIFTTIQEILFHICCSEDAISAGRIAMVAWSLWNNRNNWVWNGTKDAQRECATRAAHNWAEWDTVNIVQQCVPTTATCPELMQWQRPDYGMLKCNVDAMTPVFSLVEVRQDGVGVCVIVMAISSVPIAGGLKQHSQQLKAKLWRYYKLVVKRLHKDGSR
ncbi:hypothetical protein A2U01_0022894 [Trifolium medium]|uniref:Uncharacterized protein n=1 Tax=Trifolium medium TaxID=97028 RepID=A0A392NTR0_9FABA|nr:hypothetical protein [Trifolium medium]